MGAKPGAGSVGGVVLAAGRSERMGRTKALLDLEGRTFLAAAVEALRGGGCATVVVVAAPGPVVAAAERTGARVVVNEALDAEQVDSLRLGLTALEDAGAALVLPVDHPLVRRDTIHGLVAAWREHPEAVVRPVHGGSPGHPTLFPRAAWAALADPSLPRGARSVVESESVRTVDLPVDDPGVLADIDTPAAYRRHLGGEP